MLFNNVNKNGKNPLENLSINIARRNLCWAGVNFGGSGEIAGGCRISVS